jgi:hypothetical protein
MVLAKVKGSSILVAAQTVQTLAVGSKGPLTEAPAVLAAVRDPQAVVGAGGRVQMVHVITAIDREALALPVDGFRPLSADHCTDSSSTEAGVGHHPLAVHSLSIDADREAGAAIEGKEVTGSRRRTSSSSDSGSPNDSTDSDRPKKIASLNLDGVAGHVKSMTDEVNWKLIYQMLSPTQAAAQLSQHQWSTRTS